MKARRPTGLFLLLAVAVALSALLLSESHQPVQAQTPTVETRIWSATLTVGLHIDNTSKGYIGDGNPAEQTGALGDNFQDSYFQISDTGYRVRHLLADVSMVSVRFRPSGVGSGGNLQLPAHNYILRIGDTEYTFHGTNDYHTSGLYQFDLAGLSLTVGEKVQASLWGVGQPSVFGLYADYDLDDDNLIEVSSLQQLDAMRYDLNGNGVWDGGLDVATFHKFDAAFPNRQITQPGNIRLMGCPGHCTGYELVADLDFDTNGNGQADSGDTYWNGGSGWHPIGNRGDWSNRIAWYSAVFEGNGHTISNMYIRRTFDYYLGLFGHVSGHIRNLGMKDAYIDGGYKVGIVAGSVGNNHQQFNQHRGTAALGSVSSSYATGRITGNGYWVGGLVGELSGYVVATWTDVTIVTPPFTRPYLYFGGIVGCAYTNGAADGTVRASYSLGSIIETIPDNRIVGHPVAHLCSGGSNSYSPGTNADSYFDGNRHLESRQWARSTGQLVRPTGYTDIYEHWNVNVRGDSNADDPWDFGTNRDYPKLKADKNGDGVYTVEEFPGQDQAPRGATDYDTDDDNLIEISSMVQLNAIRFDPDGDGDVLWASAQQYPEAFPDALLDMGCPNVCKGYELVADIDHDANGNGQLDGGDWPYDDGAGFRPIGHDDDAPYTAEFNGNGYAIRNLNIHRTAKRVGLFGWINGAAYIHHVGLNDVDITSTDEGVGDVGALVGFAQGSQTRISANYATGSVTGVNQTGGLVGSNQGVMRANWADVAVTGDQHVGGLVGHNGGEVSSSYSRGSASGSSLVHGAVGLTDGGTLTQVYFDRNSHQTVTDDIHPKFRSELEKPTGYTGIYSGWNADLDGDGSADSPWDFGASISYPILKADLDGDGTATWQEFGYQKRVSTDASPSAVWADRMTAGPARLLGEAGFLASGEGGPTDREENPNGYGALVIGSFAIDRTEYSVINLSSFPVETATGTTTLHLRTEPALPGQGAGLELYLTDATGIKFGGPLSSNASPPGNTYSVYGSRAIQAGQSYLVQLQSTPSIGLSENDYRGGENFGSVIASIALSGGSDASARSVSYRLAENQNSCNLSPNIPLATPGEDFIAPSGTVTFQTMPGEHRVLTIEIPVQLINDDVDEADEEVFCIEAYNPQNAALGRAFALMRIMDDDVAKLSIEPVSRSIAPSQSALFRINMETEVPSPPDRTVNVGISSANIADVSSGTRTVELTNLQSSNGVASFDFSVPTGALQPDSVGHVTAELQASSQPVESNSAFSYRLHDSLPTSAAVQMSINLNTDVWTTQMTAGTADESVVGYLVPGRYPEGVTGWEGYGSFADGREFTIDGVDYAVDYIFYNLPNSPTVIFRTRPELPSQGVRYSLHLTNATGIKSGGRLTHGTFGDEQAYSVPGIDNIQDGETYTVELTRIINPEISIEPVNSSVRAGGDAQFRVVADMPVLKQVSVNLVIHERTYSSDGLSFSTIERTNSVTIPKGGTEAVFSFSTRDDRDRVVVVSLQDGGGYHRSELLPTSATVQVVVQQGGV